MNELVEKLRSTPLIARVAPFIIFAALTSAQGMFGENSRYWVYVAKTFVGVWLVWAVWPVVTEARWRFSWEAVVVGIGVFAMWVGIDPFYPKMGEAGTPWNPHAQFGEGSAVAWLVIVVRILGSTLVVPPLEETFYRSFVYRYIIKYDFLKVPLSQFHLPSFLITCGIFGLVHHQWLAGILCGMAYQWLVIRKNHLGDAMTAHAITNFLLGIYLVYKGAWQFW